MLKQHIVIFAGIMLLITLATVQSMGEEAEGKTAAEGVTYDRARYEVIVERAPFGAEPLTDVEDKKESAAVRIMEKNYRLCFLMESQSGEIRAGFENLKAKKGESKSMVLKVGESINSSMKLTAVDLKNSLATLEYQGKEITFDLTKPNVSAVPKPATTEAPQQRAPRRLGAGFRRTTPPPEPEPELSPEEVAEQREQTRAALQEYQMEVIRQGMPPLPIQLTPEQDSQLVEEGVLPPME